VFVNYGSGFSSSNIKTSFESGVMLTHGEMALAVQAQLYGYSLPENLRGVAISYLPLTHIYEVGYLTLPMMMCVLTHFFP